MSLLHRVARLIDRVIEGLGKAVSLLLLAMIGLIIFEMTSRGIFRLSHPWTHELGLWFLTALVFLGGPWALANGNFVRVDVIYANLSPRNKALIDTFATTVLFSIFMGVLIMLGGEFAAQSFRVNERSATGAWGGPVWVAKMLVPISGILLSFAWISHLIKVWSRSTAAGRD